MQPENQSFFKKYKKEIIIVSVAILIFILLLYFLFFYNKKNDSPNKNLTLPSKSGFSFNDLIPNIFNPANPNKENNNEENGNTEYYFEKLIKIWDKPVAGYSYYYKPYTYEYADENNEIQTVEDIKTYIQFVDSSTGFVYEKDLLSPTSSAIQITSNSYPNVMRAYFLNDKNGSKGKVFLQYLSKEGTIKTVSARVPNYYGSPAKLMNITNLPDNIKHISVSEDNKKLAYIVNKNKTVGRFQDIYTDWYYINNITDGYGKRFYTSELATWKLTLSNNGEIYAYNTDSAYDINNLYKVNLDKSGNGSLIKLFGNYTGMSFLINKNNLLASIFTGSGLKTYKYNDFNGKAFSSNSLSSLNFSTLSNKCTQNDYENHNLVICSVPKETKNYEYGLPDAWYQGMTSWDDNLYVVNDDYPNGELLFDMNKDGETKEKIDAKSLEINEYKSHLAFINKNDASLWTLNIGNILYQGD